MTDHHADQHGGLFEDVPTLAALGLDEVPFERPLSYPGRPVPGPALLVGDRLLRLAAQDGPLGRWYVEGARPLDRVLADLSRPVLAQRHAVLAVGSNASPAQVAYKLARQSLPSGVVMVPVTVHGIGIGCSAHIGRAGYVAAAPYPDPAAAARSLVVSWLDDAQLAAVDATEVPNYHRHWLPGEQFGMALPSGRPLGGAYVYIGTHGVLAGPDGRPRPGGGDQAALLSTLLAESAQLRALLGPDPQSWIRIARGDPAVRERASRIFAAEGRVIDLTWP